MTESVDDDDSMSDKLDSPPPFDVMLASFVDLINVLGEAEVGVTLHTSSGVVSGLLVSARRYVELVREEIRDSGGDDPEKQPSADAFASFFDPWVERYQELEDRARNDSDEEEFVYPQFVHLRSAGVHGPGPGAPLPGMLWRGRISAVSGWSIGNYGVID